MSVGFKFLGTEDDGEPVFECQECKEQFFGEPDEHKCPVREWSEVDEK